MRILPLLFGLSALLASAAARATPRVDDHFEATMGFVAVGHDHRDTGFSPRGSSPPLTEVFRGAPYDGAVGLGLRYDVRLVLSGVRMTAGLDLPFTSFGGVPRSLSESRAVTPRSMWSWNLRFGLGGELSFGPVTPFVDLLGAVHNASTTLSVEGASSEYAASRFGFSARAGLRVALKRWFFVTASGEVGIVGPTTRGAELGVGFRGGA